MMLQSTSIEDPGSGHKVLSRDDAFRQRLKRRMFFDRLSVGLVTLGGWAIIFSILAIVFVIVVEFLPLFKKPGIKLESVLTLSPEFHPLALGSDEYQEVSYVVGASGIRFYSLKDKSLMAEELLPELQTAAIVSVSALQRGFMVLGLSDGRALPVQVEFEVEFAENGRTVQPHVVPMSAIALRRDEQPLRVLASRKLETEVLVAGVVGAGEVEVIRVEERKTFAGTIKRNETVSSIYFPVKGEITALVFDDTGEHLLAGTSSGQVLQVDIMDPDAVGEPETVGKTKSSNVGVARLDFLLGGYTLVLSDTEGGVTSFQLFRDEAQKYRLGQIYEFASNSEGAAHFSPSLRHKGFLTAGAKTIRFHYGTTGETQLEIPNPSEGALQAIFLTPKSDGILAVDGSGKLFHWTMDHPHPEVNMNALFGKVWYEGYREPGYAWQSTGGSDEFEPKFSLVPLIFGTLKGTLYAMLFAVPFALMGALYTSQFMYWRLRMVVKPVIELMAALPSVVLGFFAALLIAPQVERMVPGIVLAPFVMIGFLVLGIVLCEKYDSQRKWLKLGREIYLLVPLVLLGGFLAFRMGLWAESLFFSGDYRAWMNEVFNVTYDQRNALVVGLAMGFAIIPIVFTIAEDSLSGVPQHLRASSLALGATPWQTAIRVILPTASPGIFSAVMIGFGRAVGETMIVLMATGNTPVMEWTIFNGFRALSANIAVELPEAPEQGTLFRILFLAAFLLFSMTFVVNTVAEWVRLRLRKRYKTI